MILLTLSILSIQSLAKPLSTSTLAVKPPIPPGCTPPLSYPITDFTFFNSTHNLDCTISHDPSEVVCFKSDSSGNQVLCDSKTDPTCTTCPPVCYTGTPDTPYGYGRPDRVAFNVPDYYASGVPFRCEQSNPQSITRYEVGEGHVGCGGAGSYAFFYGNSEKDSGSEGTIKFAQNVDCGGQNHGFGYEAKFPLLCEHDAGRNATCGTTGNPVAQLISVS